MVLSNNATSYYSETAEYMPLTMVLAHGLNKKMADERRNGNLGWLRPDVSVSFMPEAATAF